MGAESQTCSVVDLLEEWGIVRAASCGGDDPGLPGSIVAGSYMC